MAKAGKSFTSVLDRFEGNLWHFHVLVPAKIAKPFISGTNRRVECILNHTVSFHAALMPTGDGTFFINVNKEIRTKLKLKEGDEVWVEVAKDESEYGLPLPAEFAELLKQDIEGNERFHALTPGKQRTLLYIIAKPKSTDLRIRNGIVILQHLKRTGGIIIYKELALEMKQS